MGGGGLKFVNCNYEKDSDVLNPNPNPTAPYPTPPVVQSYKF